jgi:hypothetical protein
MTDVLIGNERCKAFSNLSLALCGGLLAAGAARGWEEGTIDGAVAAWLLVAAVLGFAGWGLLGFLVPEGEA